MVSLDYTLFIQIANFLILIFVLNMLLYKPILRILDRRREKIAKAEEEVKNINRTIEQRMAEYEEKIRLAKLEAMGHRNEIQQQGAQVAKELIDQAKDEISAMVEQFQRNLAAEMEQARSILNNQSRTISMEIAEKVLGRSVQ
ncbi:MAG: ATP synthase F0 subunit B [Syntrophales bacterium]